MGFFLTLREVLRARDGGLVSAGIPCASYVFMSLGTSCRSDDKPYGDESREFVKLANDICCRCSWIFLVAMIRCVAFCVEQPASTRLYAMPYMLYLEKVAAALGIPFHNTFLCPSCIYMPHVCTMYGCGVSYHAMDCATELDGHIWAFQLQAFAGLGNLVGASVRMRMFNTKFKSGAAHICSN